MKYILFILSTIVLLGSCSVPMSNTEIDNQYKTKAKGHDIYYGDFGEINTLQDISDYIKANIIYIEEPVDIWSNPEEILKRGYGDCEDFAILFSNIAYVALGLKFGISCIKCGEYSQRTIDSGGNVNHAVLYLEGQLYSAYHGVIITDNFSRYHYLFEECFII